MPFAMTSLTMKWNVVSKRVSSLQWDAWQLIPDRPSPMKIMLNCEHEFAPGIEELTMSSPSPLQADPNGIYPIPQPGLVTETEY